MADSGETKLSKNELKRRLKAEKQAAEKAEKERLKKEKAEKDGQQTIGNGPKVADAECLDPNEYFRLRTSFVNQQKEQGLNPYPHKFVVSISLTEYIEKYNHQESGQVDKSIVECVTGRIHAKRESGSKLIFLDLRAEGTKIQVMANLSFYKDQDSFYKDLNKIKRGDIVGCRGYPGKTMKGKL